ncbi:GNAT family N-acetyltransferase [Granulicella sp. 5B5]|uniref:GNAT family N-acetyltransferase n=1 Tax=Granulicella sp. 5B5 TaxID=1617967 RepID=UPI0015F5BF22|nr:GNAT family N-acetyltransferase [Granulicella sp. 5B5]QMV17565.1 GNAT family N-acetyltransferase [Granulicella sp. 5B5]
MILRPVVEADFAEVVALANLAYRGTGAGASWNVEEGIIEGQRLSDSSLREELAAKPNGVLLVWRDTEDGPLLGTAWLNPEAGGVWYLGLLTVRPDRQNRQLGRTLLAAAEGYASERGGTRIRMTVLHVRVGLIAWYERRGYTKTGDTEPFPYGDERLGKPLRDDLHFIVLEREIV